MATSEKIVWVGDCRVVLPLKLHPLGDGSKELWESSNGLVWKKKRLELEKARQEFQATQLARLLLPQDISPRSPCGVVSDYFVSEKLFCSKFDKENPDHVALAARYLGFLHKVDISAELRSNLETRFAHYFGQAMRNRLKEEADHGQQAFGCTAQELVQKLKTVVDRAIGKWKFEDAVLGHGDFQACNLFIDGKRVWPIDWTDFGLCDRAYEVEHFVQSVSPDNADLVRNEYRKIAELSSDASHRGIVAVGVIRAGNIARQVCSNSLINGPNAVSQFRDHVERAEGAMK